MRGAGAIVEEGSMVHALRDCYSLFVFFRFLMSWSAKKKEKKERKRGKEREGERK